MHRAYAEALRPAYARDVTDELTQNLLTLINFRHLSNAHETTKRFIKREGKTSK